jgi:hypothetical protein
MNMQYVILPDLSERLLDGLEALHQALRTRSPLNIGDASGSRREEALLDALNKGRDFNKYIIKTAIISNIRGKIATGRSMTNRQRAPSRL